MDADRHALPVAVVDGPYDAATLSRVLALEPVSLSGASCGVSPSTGCEHGTFVIGLLGARNDSLIPGLCPECRLVHIPLFNDARSPSASVDDLAAAITEAVAFGARLINLSLAILGAESDANPRLEAALDYAEASGAVLLVAAGNQRRLSMGQLLSHPVVIPVVAADASQRTLPDCNFGPAISSRGVTALGQMPGYAPGGGLTVMSGTSVATAVATGTLAQVWSQHPETDGAVLRSIVASLGPRTGSKPPMLDRDLVSAALDQAASAAIATSRDLELTNCAVLQGATTMATGYEKPSLVQTAGVAGKPGVLVAPAGEACGCGAPGGACTCNEAAGLTGFVYAIGTIEAEYPNVGVEREMQTLAHHFGVNLEPDRDLSTRPTEDRQWQYAVLTADRKLTRYIARQLRWRFTIEDFATFVLSPGDPSILDDFIEALNRPKYFESKPKGRSGKRGAGATSDAIEREVVRVEDLDVLVGVVGPQTPDGNIVVVDQTFRVPRERLDPPGFSYFSQLADNPGLTDEDRAYNFLAARYTPPPLSHSPEFELSRVRVVPSRLGAAGGSRIVRAIYTFRNPQMAEREYFVRVDVTHEFPTIASPMQPYVERGERS